MGGILVLLRPDWGQWTFAGLGGPPLMGLQALQSPWKKLGHLAHLFLDSRKNSSPGFPRYSYSSDKHDQQSNPDLWTWCPLISAASTQKLSADSRNPQNM